MGIDYRGFHTAGFDVLFHQTAEARGSGADRQYRRSSATGYRSEAGREAAVDINDGTWFGRWSVFATLDAAYRNFFRFSREFSLRRYHGGGGMRHFWFQIEEAMTELPNKSQPTRGGALGSSGSRGLFHAVVPTWLSSSRYADDYL